MKKYIKRIIIAVLSVFLLFPAGCGPAEDPATGDYPVIRIGYLHNDLHQLAFYVAQQKEFYREAGITVEVAGIYRSGVELMAAFQAGVLDAGYVGLAPATVAVANGKAEVTVIAQANKTGSALVVRSGLDITKPGELGGLKIAVPNIGTVQDFLLYRCLDNYSLNVSDIEKVILSPPEMMSAMISGGIDGCVVWEPYVAELQAAGHAKVLQQSGDIWSDHPCCVLVVDNTFLEKHREAVIAMSVAHCRATGFINQNEEEALELAVGFTGLTPAVVRKAMENIGFDCLLNADSAGIYVSYLTERGMIGVENHADLIDSFIDTSLLSGEGEN